MLYDYRILSQLALHLGGYALILGVVGQVYHITRYWKPDALSALQVSLERKTYLISTVLHTALLLQILLVVVFIQTANDYLPPMLRGAMCATGALSANEYGYWALGAKLCAIPFYFVFLLLNHYDLQAPNYPLTPIKYWWVLPILLLGGIDVILSIQYFIGLNPDIITTCCSVVFNDFGEATISPNTANTSVWWAVAIFLLCGGCLFGLEIFEYRWSLAHWGWYAVKLSLWGVLTAAAVISFRYFFVKYIYGLPNHYCLFDMFWVRYYFVGYLLLGAFYWLLYNLLRECILAVLGASLPASQAHGARHHIRLQNLLLIAFVLLLPLWYWWRWKGDL